MSLVVEILLVWRFVDCRFFFDCDFLIYLDCSSVFLFYLVLCFDYVYVLVNVFIVSVGDIEICNDIYVGRIVGILIVIFYVIKLKDIFNFDKLF